MTSTFPTPGAAAWIGRRWGQEVVVLGVGLHLFFAAEPAEGRPGEGQETGVFHLPLLLVFGQQADQQVHQHHGGGDPQRQEEAPQGGQDQKEKEPKQAVQVKARVPLEKGFLGFCHKRHLLEGTTVLYIIRAVQAERQEKGAGDRGEHARTLTSRR